MKESFDFWGTPEGDLIHPAECMQQLLEKVRRHKVNVDGNVCTVMVTVLVLEVIISVFSVIQEHVAFDIVVRNIINLHHCVCEHASFCSELGSIVH